MARRATAIKDARAKYSNVLLLDAGDSLFGYPISDDNQGKPFVEGMNALNYNAMAIGDQELRLGEDVLKARIAEMKFPALSANLVSNATGEPIGKPYVVQTVGGRKIAIIGLTSPDAERVTRTGQAANQPNTISVLDPLETAWQYVPKAQKETNVVIILSHLGSAVDMQIAKEVPGITAIIGGHSRELIVPPLKIDSTGTYISQAGNLGENLGVLTLNINEKGIVTDAKSDPISLTGDYADDPNMVSLLEKYREPINTGG